MGILEERRRLREEAIEKAKRWARSLPFRCSAILIGSYARGDFNLWSDVDIVLVAEFQGTPIERLRSIDYPTGFEVIPLNPEEFRRLLEKRNPIAVEAVERGVVLRDDLGIGRLREEKCGRRERKG